MSTDTANILFDCTTDAGFRVWGLRMSQAFAAVGMVQTADTGQINWASVTRTGGAGAENLHGYEIWRFNDALQATAPIFMKIEYGTVYDYNSYYGQTGIATPCIYITVGTATNGAGTLTGTLVGVRNRFLGSNSPTVNYGASGATTAYTAPTSTTPMHTAGGTGYFNFALGATAAAQPTFGSMAAVTRYGNFPAMFGIERSRNSDGTANGDGFYVMATRWINNWTTVPTSVTPTWQIHTFAGGGLTTTSQDGYIPFAFPGQSFGTATAAGDAYFFPLVMATPKPQAQCLSWLGTYKSDVALLTPQTITVLGAAHNYLSLAGIAGTANNDNTRSRSWDGIPNGAMMMRFE